MEPNKDSLSQGNYGAMPLPNATSTLVLGILSIVICFICGIVALVLANKDIALYKNNPGLYSEASYNNVKAGNNLCHYWHRLTGGGLNCLFDFRCFFDQQY